VTRIYGRTRPVAKGTDAGDRVGALEVPEACFLSACHVVDRFIKDEGAAFRAEIMIPALASYRRAMMHV
jgi:hypothetical protein